MKHAHRVVVVAREPQATRLLEDLGLASGSEFDFEIVTDVNQARLADGDPDVVLYWLEHGGKGPLDDLQALATGPTAVVVVADAANEDKAERLVLGGCHDYLISDAVDTHDSISSLRRAIARAQGAALTTHTHERYALAAAASADGIWDWELGVDRVHFSPQWLRILGLEEGDIGHDAADWLARIHSDDRAQVEAEREAHFAGGAPFFVSDHRVLHRNGSYRWVQLRGLAARDAHGRPYRLAGTMRDTTEQRSAEEQLRHGAFYDALTGLSNRAVLMDRLGRSVEQTKRRGDYNFALLFLDLDGFKLINDSCGHGVGDELLVAVGHRLKKCVRTADTLARVGGDEFAMILDDIRNLSDALRVAKRIQESLREPFQIAGHEIVVGSSIGIASSVAGYTRPEDILRDADIAMYRAKGQGKGRYEIFDQAMHIQAVDRLTLESDLRSAIENDQLRVHYQPIVSLTSRQITGFEALVRWEHPVHGLIPPAKFIPVAEESQLIVEIDRWVLRRACGQMRDWQNRFETEPPLVVSVNLSPRQLAQADVVEHIRRVLDETGLDPQSFRPEITESVLMENMKDASHTLDELWKMNVLLHVDDFGTGYSSLSHLLQFRVSTLKIDGSFVTHMESGGESVEIVRMIVSVAHNLGIKVIAEGVETAGQLGQLVRLGCEFGQGYFFSKPVTAEQVEDMLEGQAAGERLAIG